jgi:hypothetical protein
VNLGGALRLIGDRALRAFAPRALFSARENVSPHCRYVALRTEHSDEFSNCQGRAGTAQSAGKRQRFRWQAVKALVSSGALFRQHLGR